MKHQRVSSHELCFHVLCDKEQFMYVCQTIRSMVGVFELCKVENPDEDFYLTNKLHETLTCQLIIAVRHPDINTDSECKNTHHDNNSIHTQLQTHFTS